MNLPSTCLRMLAAGTLLALAGCTSIRPPAEAPPDERTAEEVLASLPRVDLLPQVVTLQASIEISARGERSSFQARVAWKRDDSLYVSIRAPLGIEVARLLLTADSVFAYDRVAKTVYFGDSGAAQHLVPGFFGSLAETPAVFGLDPPLAHEGWDRMPDDTYTRLERRDGLETLLVDASVGRIAARDLRDLAGTVVEQRRYSVFDEFEGRLLPRRIVLLRPGDDLRASMYVRRLDLTPESPRFELDAPVDIHRIPLR